MNDKEAFWIQPLFFGPPHLTKFDNDILCRFVVDISFGHKLMVEFSSSGFISRLQDGSEFYKCSISGTPNLHEFSTGQFQLSKQNEPFLKLYHHTSKETKDKIQKSGYYKPSSWNIQGNKKLNNVGYVYFTCLDKIKTDDDLIQIAMASDGRIGLRVDQNLSNLPDVILDVYRDSTLKRKENISHFVRADILSPQHIYLHRTPPDGLPVYYGIVKYFIYRIGIEPDTKLFFNKEHIETQNLQLKRFDYIILGDASTLEGLEAPYDEENTQQVFKIEKVDKEKNILEFWFNHSNQDHFSCKNIDFQKFEEDGGVET